jgi:hypothetical protein
MTLILSHTLLAHTLSILMTMMVPLDNPILVLMYLQGLVNDLISLSTIDNKNVKDNNRNKNKIYVARQIFGKEDRL